MTKGIIRSWGNLRENRRVTRRIRRRKKRKARSIRRYIKYKFEEEEEVEGNVERGEEELKVGTKTKAYSLLVLIIMISEEGKYEDERCTKMMKNYLEKNKLQKTEEERETQ